MPQISGKTVTANQDAVYGVLEELGPLADHALVPLAQHMLGVHQSSSGIRSRRAELTDLGLVVQTASTKTSSGRTAGVFDVVRQMALSVTVYSSLDDDEPQVFEDVDYVSLVSGESYGPPALVAPAKGQTGPARAQVGDSVLYLNTRFVPMFEIERITN